VPHACKDEAYQAAYAQQRQHRDGHYEEYLFHWLYSFEIFADNVFHFHLRFFVRLLLGFRLSELRLPESQNLCPGEELAGVFPSVTAFDKALSCVGYQRVAVYAEQLARFYRAVTAVLVQPWLHGGNHDCPSTIFPVLAGKSSSADTPNSLAMASFSSSPGVRAPANQNFTVISFFLETSAIRFIHCAFGVVLSMPS
jgi:hypothetical protein